MTRRFPTLLLLSLLFSITAVAVVNAASVTPSPNTSKAVPETALHRIQSAVARIDAEARTPEGEERVLARLSAQLGVGADSLREEHATWGLGYGEIAMAYGFSRSSRTGKTPADVVEMRASGTGWIEIAKALGVKIDAVANRMKRHVAPKARR